MEYEFPHRAVHSGQRSDPNLFLPMLAASVASVSAKSGIKAKQLYVERNPFYMQ